MKYNGSVVIWDDCRSNLYASVAKSKLEGGLGIVQDKCVNGFLFNEDKLHERPEVRNLGVPEILQQTLLALNRKDICKEWMAQKRLFVIIFKAKVDDLVFDDASRLSDKAKKIKLINSCINYLMHDRKNNPVIRLKDDLSVVADDIVKVINPYINKC